MLYKSCKNPYNLHSQNKLLQELFSKIEVWGFFLLFHVFFTVAIICQMPHKPFGHPPPPPTHNFLLPSLHFVPPWDQTSAVSAVPALCWLNIYVFCDSRESCFLFCRLQHSDVNTYRPGRSRGSRRCTSHWQAQFHSLSWLLPENYTGCPSPDLDKKQTQHTAVSH